MNASEASPMTAIDTKTKFVSQLPEAIMGRQSVTMYFSFHGSLMNINFIIIVLNKSLNFIQFMVSHIYILVIESLLKNTGFQSQLQM